MGDFQVNDVVEIIDPMFSHDKGDIGTVLRTPSDGTILVSVANKGQWWYESIHGKDVKLLHRSLKVGDKIIYRGGSLRLQNCIGTIIAVDLYSVDVPYHVRYDTKDGEYYWWTSRANAEPVMPIEDMELENMYPGISNIDVDAKMEGMTWPWDAFVSKFNNSFNLHEYFFYKRMARRHATDGSYQRLEKMSFNKLKMGYTK